MLQNRLRTTVFGASLVAWGVAIASATVFVSVAHLFRLTGGELRETSVGALFLWSIFSNFLTTAPGSIVFGAVLGRFVRKSLLSGKPQTLLLRQVLVSAGLLGIGYGVVLGVLGMEGIPVPVVATIGGLTGLASGFAVVRAVRSDYLYDIAASRAA